MRPHDGLEEQFQNSRLRQRDSGTITPKMRFREPKGKAIDVMQIDDSGITPPPPPSDLPGNGDSEAMTIDEESVHAPPSNQIEDQDEQAVNEILGHEGAKAKPSDQDSDLAKVLDELKLIKRGMVRLYDEVHRGKASDQDGFADDESDGTPHKKSNKRNTGRKPKEAWINELHSDIRSHTMHLMEREDRNDAFPPPPSREDVKRYAQGDRSVGPSKSNFVVDLNGGAASDWNKAVAKLFTDDFLKVGWYKCKNKKEITNRFKTHMGSLIQDYRQQLKEGQSSVDAAHRLSMAARRRRKLQLYYRRLGAAKVHPQLRSHVDALQNLGVDGMSSDESSVEDNDHLYVVFKKPWRAAAVTLWLRDFDAVHLSLRVTETGRVMRGNWPHERRDSSRISDRAPVEGLPINFYCGDWLSMVPSDKVEDLDAIPQRYDFSHTDTIAKIVSRWRSVRGPSDVPKWPIE